MKIEASTTLNKNRKVRWHTQDENMHWITTKQTMGLIFNIQNSQLLNWSSPTQESFQVQEKGRTLANLAAVGFRLFVWFLFEDSTSQCRKKVRSVKKFELYPLSIFPKSIFLFNSVIKTWDKSCLESFIQSEPL